jgi:hypothetical protein
MERNLVSVEEFVGCETHTRLFTLAKECCSVTKDLCHMLYLTTALSDFIFKNIRYSFGPLNLITSFLDKLFKLIIPDSA